MSSSGPALVFDSIQRVLYSLTPGSENRKGESREKAEGLPSSGQEVRGESGPFSHRPPARAALLARPCVLSADETLKLQMSKGLYSENTQGHHLHFIVLKFCPF